MNEFGFSPAVPNVARMYDYMLGGKDNYAADREAVDEMLARSPDARALAMENRGFLRRAVRFLVGEAGITQLVDIGAGLPTAENTHEVAQSVTPDARVLYVDNDPVVITHASALLEKGSKGVRVLNADLRQPWQINTRLRDGGFFDSAQPTAVLLVAILHFISDADDPYGTVARLMDATAPGSYLVISHASADNAREDEVKRVQQVYGRSQAPLSLRSREKIARFFDGLALVEPGIVNVCAWRKSWPPGRRALSYAGVARKP
jgi:O-methyltransferase involved in polyketide biosynthesis